MDSNYTMHETDSKDALSMVTARAKASTTEGKSRLFRDSGLVCSHSQTVYNTKGTRAHTHRELIRKWLWEPKRSSLEHSHGESIGLTALQPSKETETYRQCIYKEQG